MSRALLDRIRPGRVGEVLPIAGILALGLGLRLWMLFSQSLSSDEVYEIGLASQPVRAIVVSHDGFPPLYHLLAHAWLRLGDPLSLRLLSVGLGMLTIAALWQLGRLAGGERCGLVTAFLLAVSPVHVWFSQEARAYALYFCLAVATIWLFYRAWASDRPRDWALYVVAAVLAAYTHYYSALLVATLLVSVAIEARSRGDLRRLLGPHVLIAVLALPALVLLRGDLGLQQSVDLVRPSINLVSVGYAGFTFLAGFTLGASLRELHWIPAGQAVREALPWVLILGSATVYLGAAALLDRTRRAWALRLSLLVLLPVAATAVLGVWLGVGFRVRYVIWCAAPLLALLALGAARRLDRPAGWLAVGALCVAAGVAIVNRQVLPRHMNEDMRGAAGLLTSESTSATPVFVVAAYMAPPLRFYLDRLGDRRGLRPVYRYEWEHDTIPPMHSIRATAGSEPFWLVYSRAFDGDPKGVLLDSLSAEAGLTRRAVLPGVDLYHAIGFGHSASGRPSR